jgi:ribonuclease P protein component
MRLRRQAEFDAVFRGGARVHGEQVTVVGKLGAPGIRLGVPCGKRYSKRAVDRNRFRRLVREIFRRAASTLPSGLDFVVVPRGKPAGTSLAALEREIPKLVHRLARKLEEQAKNPVPKNPQPKETDPKQADPKKPDGKSPCSDPS